MVGNPPGGAPCAQRGCGDNALRFHHQTRTGLQTHGAWRGATRSTRSYAIAAILDESVIVAQRETRPGVPGTHASAKTLAAAHAPLAPQASKGIPRCSVDKLVTGSLEPPLGSAAQAARPAVARMDFAAVRQFLGQPGPVAPRQVQTRKLSRRLRFDERKDHRSDPSTG